jgi:copper chaperone NosL
MSLANSTPVSPVAGRSSQTAMGRLLFRADHFFEMPLTFSSRILVLIAVLLLLPAFFTPLYTMTLYSNQFPDGLNLYIRAGSLQGGHTADRDDLKEINTLNHYIGMRALHEADFTEFKWIPLMLGFFVILGLRAIVIGRMSNLIDTFVLFAWFGLFSLWHFYDRLYTYGHNLDPEAPVRVAPFMPPVFGSKQMANFEVYNYPAMGSYFLLGFTVLLVIAVFLSARRTRNA